MEPDVNLTEIQRGEIAVNRANYEKLKAAGQGATPRALPDLTPKDGATLAAEHIVARETIPGGWYFFGRLKAGEGLRLVNPTGRSSVALVAWNARDISERLNHADTVKVQWSASLRKGRLLLSDMGKVVFSITQDTLGAHDALVGGSTAASNAKKYGGDRRNARDNLRLAAAKLGLSVADLPQPVVFFAPVEVDEHGRFVWNEAKRASDDFVDLRAEMDLLFALSNTPHPFDPAPDYAPGDVEAIRFRLPTPIDDYCRTGSAEAIRAFQNNAAAALA
jgi:urea carboxylase-associated protein 2